MSRWRFAKGDAGLYTCNSDPSRTLHC